MERSTYTRSGHFLEPLASASTEKIGAESYLCQYNLAGGILSRQSGGVPRPRGLDSLGSTTRRSSGSEGAGDDTSLRALSSDKSRGEGENDESGEAEHGVALTG